MDPVPLTSGSDGDTMQAEMGAEGSAGGGDKLRTKEDRDVGEEHEREKSERSGRHS